MRIVRTVSMIVQRSLPVVKRELGVGGGGGRGRDGGEGRREVVTLDEEENETSALSVPPPGFRFASLTSQNQSISVHPSFPHPDTNKPALSRHPPDFFFFFFSLQRPRRLERRHLTTPDLAGGKCKLVHAKKAKALLRARVCGPIFRLISILLLCRSIGRSLICWLIIMRTSST